MRQFFKREKAERDGDTLSAIRSFCRFCKHFSESFPCLPGQEGSCITTVELAENIIQNLVNDLMADSVKSWASVYTTRHFPLWGREERARMRESERSLHFLFPGETTQLGEATPLGRTQRARDVRVLTRLASKG